MPATVKVKPVAAPEADAAPENPTSFTIQLSNGSMVTCHKPTTVLKLRLRRILSKEELEDNELREIAKALLCITDFDGIKPPLRTPAEFEIFLSRFSTDDDVDRFMSEWQKLNYPDVYDALTAAVSEGTEQGLYGTELESFVAAKIQTLARERAEQVK